MNRDVAETSPLDERLTRLIAKLEDDDRRLAEMERRLIEVKRALAQQIPAAS